MSYKAMSLPDGGTINLFLDEEPEQGKTRREIHVRGLAVRRYAAHEMGRDIDDRVVDKECWALWRKADAGTQSRWIRSTVPVCKQQSELNRQVLICMTPK